MSYIYRRKSADFGSVDQGSYKDEGDSEKESEEGSGGGDLVSGIVNKAVGGLLGSDLCGCANKDEEAEQAKKDELETKYPTRDCGPNPTAACTAYNAQQLASRDAEFKAWQAAKDAEVADALPMADKEKFAFAAELAKEMRARHPEAGNMKLSELYKRYPDDFDQIYAQLSTKYPILKTIDAETALAMSPAIANMTLDEIIAKTTAMSGGSRSTGSSGAGTAAGIGIGLLALVGGFFWLKSRD
jgi:hypothetical protein